MPTDLLNFESLADHLPQLVWSNRFPEGVDYFNEAWCSYTGMSKTQSIETWRSAIFPDDLRVLDAAWAKARDHDCRYEIEIRIRGHDGVYRWHLVHSHLFESPTDGTGRWYGTCTDIHDQRERQERLKVNERKYLSLIDHMLDYAILFLDAEGRIESWSAGARHVLGYEGEEVFGLNHRVLFAPEVRAREIPEKELEQAKEYGKSHFEGYFQRKDGTRFWAHNTTVTTCDESSGVVRFTQILLDLTHRKRAEDELRNAKEAADSASIAKSRFLANMSHEIRTPLAAILGYADMLKEEANLSQRARECASTISKSGRHLLNIINDVLDLSRIEADNFLTESGTFRPRQLVDEVIGLFSLDAERKGISISSEVDAAVPEVVASDARLIRQILTNLLGNSLKFTDTGSIALNVDWSSDGSSGTGNLKFTVKDSGFGIDSTDHEKIFEPFVQADNTNTRKYGGTGLGLALSRQWARKLGGDLILVESARTKGSTFLLKVKTEIPQSRESKDIEAHFPKTYQEREPSTSRRAIEVKSPNLRTKRILVVDDARDNQLLLAWMLRATGATVHFANNGEEGVSVARADHFDVILMDIQMPGIDGYEAARLLREQGFQGPLIAVTAHAMKEERERCLNSGFDGYLTKPVDRGALLELVSHFSSSLSAS